MKKAIITLAVLLLAGTTVKAQDPVNGNFLDVIEAMSDMAFDARFKGDMAKAQEITCLALELFDLQSPEVCDRYRLVKADLYYTLARYYALDKKTSKAVDSLSKAVDSGWCRYRFAAADDELDNIRHNRRFRGIMSGGRAHGAQFVAF